MSYENEQGIKIVLKCSNFSNFLVLSQNFYFSSACGQKYIWAWKTFSSKKVLFFRFFPIFEWNFKCVLLITFAHFFLFLNSPSVGEHFSYPHDASSNLTQKHINQNSKMKWKLDSANLFLKVRMLEIIKYRRFKTITKLYGHFFFQFLLSYKKRL